MFWRQSRAGQMRSGTEVPVLGYCPRPDLWAQIDRPHAKPPHHAVARAMPEVDLDQFVRDLRSLA